MLHIFKSIFPFNRKKHAKKLKESKTSWWNDQNNDECKTHIPKVQSCTDMMYQYSLPKKNIVRFEVLNISLLIKLSYGKIAVTE